MMTGRPGIFAGGDMVPDHRSVTIATGHGKRAARHIDAWLRGTSYARPPKHPIIEFSGLNLPIFSDAVRAVEPQLPVEARERGFDEVVTGLGEAEASTRRGAACPAATASNATIASPPVRKTRSRSRAGTSLCDHLRTLHGVRRAWSNARVTPWRWCGARLNGRRRSRERR
jgi:hypothetical protein